MEDKKISYTIKWSQPYPYAMDFIVIDLTEAFEAAVEEDLTNNQFPEALEVINMIRNKQ